MAELCTYTCDECGKLKGDANHWFFALIFETGSGSAISISPWAARGCESFIMADHQYRNRSSHLCSESCASKAMSKFLGSVTK